MNSKVNSQTTFPAILAALVVPRITYILFPSTDAFIDSQMCLYKLGTTKKPKSLISQ